MQSLDSYTFDAETELHDGTAVTSSSAGSTAFLDLSGPNLADDAGSGAVTEAKLIADVRAADDGDADETYVIALQGDNDSGFGSAVNLAEIEVVRGELGRVELGVINRKQGTVYRYVRAFVTVGGTSPSIEAQIYLAKMARPA